MVQHILSVQSTFLCLDGVCGAPLKARLCAQVAWSK